MCKSINIQYIYICFFTCFYKYLCVCKCGYVCKIRKETERNRKREREIQRENKGEKRVLFKAAMHIVTWSGEIFPSSATMVRSADMDPNRGTASPTRRYRWPLVLKTSVTFRGLGTQGHGTHSDTHKNETQTDTQQ